MLNRLGADVTRVSLYRSDGMFIDDLTRHMTSGSFTRTLNGTSTFTGSFNSDFNVKFNHLDCWSTWIMCERGSDERGLSRISGKPALRDQWFGPVTNFNENDGVYNVVASDITAYWKRAFLPTVMFDRVDVAELLQALIEQIFRDNLPALPELDVEAAGSLHSVTYESSTYTYLADIVADLPRLNYCAFGKRLYLRGIDSQGSASLKLNDESWVSPPAVEKAGNLYANQVVVKGTGVSGVAEADTDETGFYGLLSRRFERPEIVTVASAKQAAEELLSQTRDATYMNMANATRLSPDVPIFLEELIPGILVDVDHSVTTRPIQQRLLLSNVTVDCLSGGVSIGLEPLKTLQEV